MAETESFAGRAVHGSARSLVAASFVQCSWAIDPPTDPYQTRGDEPMATDVPALEPQTAPPVSTPAAPDDLGLDRAFVLQMARMPFLALIWVVAAVVAHQVWAAVSPGGLNAGPLVV